MIETLLSDNQLWFQDELNKLLDKGYCIINTNTICDSCDRVIWTAILKR